MSTLVYLPNEGEPTVVETADDGLDWSAWATSRPTSRPMTLRERLTARLWNIRFRIANAIYPPFKDDAR